MTTLAKPWADSPHPLTETPSKNRPVGFFQFCVRLTTEIAHVHNNLLRSLNCIYHQAPHVKHANDISDLLSYCSSWYDFGEYHHHLEETVLSPAPERIVDKPGTIERNVGQHNAPYPEFYAFKCLVRTTAADGYDREVLVGGIVDDSATILQQHLKAEVDTLLKLEYRDELELG